MKSTFFRCAPLKLVLKCVISYSWLARDLVCSTIWKQTFKLLKVWIHSQDLGASYM